MENNAEVLSGLVLGRMRDGRCRYDPQVKQELVKRRDNLPVVSVSIVSTEQTTECFLVFRCVPYIDGKLLPEGVRSFV